MGRDMMRLRRGILLNTPHEESASGAVASFKTDIGKLKGLSVAVEPVQDLNGYDAPWPPGGGKNKLPADTVESVTLNKVFTFSSPLPAGTYTFSVQSIDRTLGSNQFQVGFYKDTTRAYGYYAVSGTTKKVTITTTETMSKVVVYSEKAYNESVGVTTVFTGLMLETGSTATSYSPYSNVCPISGWSEAKVTRCGKNLVDIESPEKDGYYDTNGAYNYFSDYSCYLVPCKPNTTYTVSGNFAGIKTFWDANLNFISGINQGSGQTKTFTTPSGALFFRISILKTNVDGTQQIELGSTATTYEPFSGDTYSIDLDGTRYGGTLDVLTGVMTVDRAMATFDGSSDEGWNPSNISNPLYYAIWNNPSSASNSDSTQLANWAKFVGGAYQSFGAFRAQTNGAIVVGNLDGGVLGAYHFATREDLKAYLAEHNLEVCYKLASPFTVQLSPTQFRALKGQNNIFADCGDTAVKYWKHGG